MNVLQSSGAVEELEKKYSVWEYDLLLHPCCGFQKKNNGTIG